MKHIIFAALFLISSLGNVLSAYATEKIDYAGINFYEARSLVDLPEHVGVLLGKGHRGASGIADRDAKFNATDTLLPGDEKLPWRRFGLAAISANFILVAIEHGGRGYNVELWVFERSNGEWRGEKHRTIFSVPRSVQELIDNASK